MEQILDAPSPGSGRMKYAGFWIRFVAYILDAIVLYIAQYVLMYLFMDDLTNINEYNFWSIYSKLLSVSTITSLLYFAGMESSVRQGTLDKMALNLKVVDRNGQRITFMNALGRYLGKILSTVILMVGFIMAGFDSKKQALHDKLAGTFVIQG